MEICWALQVIWSELQLFLAAAQYRIFDLWMDVNATDAQHFHEVLIAGHADLHTDWLCSASTPEITCTWRRAGGTASHITENITAFTQRHISALTFDPSAEYHNTSVTGKTTTEETSALNVNCESQICFFSEIYLILKGPLCSRRKGDTIIVSFNIFIPQMWKKLKTLWGRVRLWA